MPFLPTFTRARRRLVGAVVTALAVAAALAVIPTASSASGVGPHSTKPTMVLVHGAFADASALIHR
jgi:hypothetical protein